MKRIFGPVPSFEICSNKIGGLVRAIEMKLTNRNASHLSPSKTAFSCIFSSEKIRTLLEKEWNVFLRTPIQKKSMCQVMHPTLSHKTLQATKLKFKQ